MEVRRPSYPQQPETDYQHAQERLETLASLPEVWRTIYGDQPGYLGLFAAERRAGRLVLPQSLYLPWPAAATTAPTWVARQDDHGREVYQCAHLLTQPQRRKATAAPVRSLWVDLDHDCMRSDVPPASVVVESSPGRLQLYWRLTEAVLPATAEAANRQLAQALRADPSGWDMTQLLRVPATSNHKYPEHPPVRLLRCSAQAYSLAELVQIQTARPERDRRQSASPPYHSTSLQLSPAAQRVVDGQTVHRKADGTVDRSRALVQIARVLYEAGASRSELVAALAERDFSLGWEKYTYRRDAVEQYERIVDVIARGARTWRRSSSRLIG